MFSKFSRKTVAVVGVVSLVAAGGAYAYWSQGGSGTGSASNATSTSIVVNQAAVTGLYPGGPAVALSGTFDNGNAGAVRVATVTASLVDVSGSVGTPACTIDDYVLASPTATVNAEIPTGLAKGSWSGPTIRLTDAATNQDACKNAVVNISYTSN